MKDTMGTRIRELRIMRGMTQQDLADKLFMNKSTISAYENDVIDIKCSVLADIANVLNALPGYFFGAETEGDEEKEVASLIHGIKDARVRRAALEHVRITRRLAELKAV